MKKFIAPIVLSLCTLIGIGLYQFFQFHDDRLHITFCDVGQGDSMLIRTPGGSTILVDGGPDSSVINCLHKYLPFWQRDISLVLMTHPHADHLQGLLYVFDRYHIGHFVTEDLKNKTFGYTQLWRKISEKHIPYAYAIAGDEINFGPVGGKDAFPVIHIVGPTKAFLDATSPTGMIGENKEFASLETLITFGNFSAFLTGDSQADELQNAIANIGAKNLLPLHLSVLQVPHHGSATGLTREVLTALQPSAAVISVGAHNLYHHPNPFTLALLKEAQIPYKRTDQRGDIEVVSDGKTWILK